jgi:hypothetical protein
MLQTLMARQLKKSTEMIAYLKIQENGLPQTLSQSGKCLEVMQALVQYQLLILLLRNRLLFFMLYQTAYQ